MADIEYYKISGKQDGGRIESRILEERIQRAVDQGHRHIEVDAFGQHGIGGRLWRAGDDEVHVRVSGHSGQRAGSMGYPNTRIEIMGPASDDVGWLNAGSEIVIHGGASNGVMNGAAQGRVYIAGSIGARGMTMTKSNPRFDEPELWVLGSTGDYFGEFMAGGVVVVCGHGASDENVFNYRPFVGMVRGRAFFRGECTDFSRADAKIVPVTNEDWDWLKKNLKLFLEKIHKPQLFDKLTDRKQWKLLTSLSPKEKASGGRPDMKRFRSDVWDRELGRGGLIGDLTDMDMSPVPVITTGDLRRFVPVWENRKYKAPCEAACPSGIPVQERWRLIREGNLDEAVEMALDYTPFPAAVCGYLCPNLCMASCTKGDDRMEPIDVKELGRASIRATLPDLPPVSDKKIAVIGGGPGGVSAAWQLRREGYKAIVFDMEETLGGKMLSVIPESRLPKDVAEAELERLKDVVPHVRLKKKLTSADLERLKEEYKFIVIAIGARKPRKLPVPGFEKSVSAMDFLGRAKSGTLEPGKRVVIIGAGNVGCDVATEASRLGAEEIILIDVQKPAAFGQEKEDAEAVGAEFRWPCFTREITSEGVKLETGELIPADTVVVSVGDEVDPDMIGARLDTDRGFIRVNEFFQTSDPNIFAIGDAVKPGLLTDAIGDGSKAASAIIRLLDGKVPVRDEKQVIDKKRVSLEYFDPRTSCYDDLNHNARECSSCGTCRDCGICVAVCPEAAITRVEMKQGYETVFGYKSDPEKCIGCGFCAGACPCGVWSLVPNKPYGS